MRYLLVILCLFICSFADSQPPVVPAGRNMAVGANHRAADSALVSSFNLGLFTNTDTLHGFQWGLLTSVVRRDMQGVNWGNLFALTLGESKGLQMAGLINATGQRMHGFQLAGLSNVAGQMQGVQIAGMSNISRGTLHGLQFSAISNIAMGVNLGTQASLVANVSTGRMRGVQMGGYNYADTVHGLQLGIVNVCVANPKGAQIGLVNYSRDTLHHRYGLINLHPDTKMDVLFFGGTGSLFNTALRLQNGTTYNIIGIGTHYRGLDKRFSGAVYYRIGQTFRITDRWRYGVDIGFHHIETFTEGNDDVPERMYSIQPRLTTDYRLTKSFGLHASLGYESTHWYDGGGTYRQGLIVEAGLSYRLRPLFSRGASPYYHPARKYSLRRDSTERHPWIAAAEVTFINAGVHLFDRYVTNEPFAQTTLHSIGDNFRNAFVWDNDFFNTNMFAHPYHGNLYFTAARSNGMNFWQSYPFALGGSLMWEFFGENTPPSINDIFATSIGGTALGETLFRISALPLDDSQRGWPRFWRELLAGIVSPMRGLNRIITGDAWRVRSGGNRYHDYERLPINFAATVGTRYLAEKGALFHGEYNPYVNFMLNYGDPLSDENRPYDFFSVDATFSAFGNQPVVNAIHLVGQLWATDINSGGRHLSDDAQDPSPSMKFGLYQHFNFYNSEAIRDGSDIVPYRIGEAASVGAGFIYRLPKIGNLTRLEQRIFLNGIILGGSLSDYFRILERDYNLGSGLSAKVQTMMQFGRYARFSLGADFYKIWTWKGYDAAQLEGRDLEHDTSLEYTNAQGDVGNAALFVLNPRLQVNLSRHLLFDLYGSYYYRRTHYRDHPDISVHTFEVRAGLTYEL